MRFIRSLRWPTFTEWLAVLLSYWIVFPKETHAAVSAIATIAFVLICTLFACQRRETGIRALVGIVLYATSWPVTHFFGNVGLVLCALGIVIWFDAGLRGFFGLCKRAERIQTS